MWGSYVWKKWDDDENAWKVFRDTGVDGPAGMTESVLVPAGSTVYLAGEIKLSSDLVDNILTYTQNKQIRIIEAYTMMVVQQVLSDQKQLRTLMF